VIVTFSPTYNGMRLLRKYVREKFEIKHTGSIYAHNDNFLPYNYRLKLKEEGIKYKKIHKWIVKLLMRNTEENEKVVISFLKEKYGKIPYMGFTLSLTAVEICFDVVTPCGSYLPSDNNVKASCMARTQSSSDFKYKNDFGDKELYFKSIKPTKGMEKLGFDGYCLDGSAFELYTKEESKNETLGRFEIKFQNKKIIKKYVRDRRFSSKEELLKIINTMAKTAFVTAYGTLNIEPFENYKKFKKKIKEYCKRYFKEYWEEALKDLTTGSCSIVSGGKGKSINAVVKKARELRRKEILLYSPRRCIYRVSKKWMNSRYSG